MTEDQGPVQVHEERFVIANRPDEIELAQRRLLESICRGHRDESDCFALRLAMEEAFGNAFKHGNDEDPDKTVRVAYRLDADSVIIDVEDQGPGFDWSSVPDPTTSENIEIPSGRGIMLMRAFMTDVQFLGNGNRVRMTYQWPDRSEQKA